MKEERFARLLGLAIQAALLAVTIFIALK